MRPGRLKKEDPSHTHPLTQHNIFVPRLATGDYGDLVRELKRVLQKDANINCAAEAANVAGALGLGLRKDFAGQAKVGRRGPGWKGEEWG